MSKTIGLALSLALLASLTMMTGAPSAEANSHCTWKTVWHYKPHWHDGVYYPGKHSVRVRVCKSVSSY